LDFLTLLGFPFETLVGIPIKKARAGFPVAPVVFIFYSQTTKLEGVNPPNFEVYISVLINGLRGIGGFYPLDKIFGRARFWGLGMNRG
jgi:hypothetical protein